MSETSLELWLDCLWQALEELEISDPQREQFWSRLEPLSIQVVNGGTGAVPPRRYPFDWMLRRHRYPALGMCRR